MCRTIKNWSSDSWVDSVRDKLNTPDAQVRIPLEKTLIINQTITKCYYSGIYQWFECDLLGGVFSQSISRLKARPT